MSLKFEELNFEITKTQWEIEKKKCYLQNIYPQTPFSIVRKPSKHL